MSLKTTALNALHRELGGRLVDFAGWELPVQFVGILAEHQHTRQAASLFDVSHMGQLIIRPASGNLDDAATALESVIPASVLGLSEGRQRYGLLTTPNGGVIDDLMFARHHDCFFVVVNASRVEEDLAVFSAVPGITIERITDRSLVALQGPAAVEALSSMIPAVADLVFMDSQRFIWEDVQLWVSRSGYTGEDGFEVSVPDTHIEKFARALLALEVVLPAGLGARDSLRLEAGMPLYGHELSTEISPVEAGLGWAIPKVRRAGGSRAGGFPGAEVILEQLTSGTERVRVGLRAVGKAPVRDGASLFLSEAAELPVATVTSGGYGATVGAPIAMAMIPSNVAVGETIYAEVRGKRLPMIVTELPFVAPSYKR